MIPGITRSGSAAANGIAPSVMNEAPRSQPALPFSRLGEVEQLGSHHRGERQSDRGPCPASMTAAITFSSGSPKRYRPRPGPWWRTRRRPC